MENKKFEKFDEDDPNAIIHVRLLAGHIKFEKT